MASLVNQRPIERRPNDSDDGAYLCPNDMLLGRASSEVPQGPFQERKDPRTRVEFIQIIVYRLGDDGLEMYSRYYFQERSGTRIEEIWA